MDSVHANDTRSVQGVNDASNQLFSIQSNAEFGHFKKPRFSKAMRNSRLSLTINRSKLDIPFKSELCMLFRKGKCYYGDNCHYAHRINDIRNPTMRGLENGYQRNTMNKWKMSFRFSSGKDCPYGDKCQFLHELVGGYRESSATRMQEFECRSRVSEAEFSKDKALQQVEKYGICYYGVNCLYAHGQDELRRPGSLAEMERAYSSNAKIVVVQSNDSGNKSAHELMLRGKMCFMKWNVEKIGHIYADWIES